MSLQSAQAKMARKLNAVSQDDFCRKQVNDLGVPAAACARNYEDWKRKIPQMVQDWAAGIQNQ